MAKTVDDRVVAMSFENAKFESAIGSTISSLEKLKRALHFAGATKGLDDITNSAGRVNLGHIASAVDSINSKFHGLGLVATTTLATITSRVANAGLSFVKSLTVQPLIDGFHDYETQINAVQTILANTGLKGKAGLSQVTGVLKDLQHYANQTVYNFADMAKNIGTFTAAGVDLKTSQESIKGIANLAALSGSNAEQASTAMYQLSQAIAAGRVKLQDWNSVVNAGMGGKVFQEALFNTATAMGTIKSAKLGETFSQWTAAGNTFRGSLQAGWLTSKVLTTTLKGFTGEMTSAQLKAAGYTAAQIAHIKDIGSTAFHAATNIKTMSQLTQALKEEVATAWGQVFTTIFGNITQATSLFSKAHTILENALTGPIYALNTLLQKWSALGGRADAIDAIKNAVKDFHEVLKPIKQAWRDIFPATTAQELFSFTQKIDDLTKKLKPSPQTVDELRRTFRGLFAALDIGKTIIGDVFHVFEKLFGIVAGPAGGGFLSITAHIGDFLTKLDQMIKKGNVLTAFFSGLSSALQDPAKLFQHIKDAIDRLFGGFDSGGISHALSNMNNQLQPMDKITTAVQKAWDKLTGSLHQASSTIQPLVQGVQHLFTAFVQFLTQSFQNMNFTGMLHAIDTGLLAGIFLLFKKFFSGAKVTDLVGGGIFGSVKETIEGLTGSLHAMQTNLKANALLQIAIAVGILSAGILALSTIDPKKLNSALGGLTVAFGELIGALALLNKASGNIALLKIPAIALGLDLLAVAVLLLTAAVKKMSGLNWDQLLKGLAGVGVLLFTISKTVGPIAASSSGMITAGLGIIAIATGVRILAGAVKEFGDLRWEQLVKGLGGVAAVLVGIGLAAKLFPTGMVSIGVGLIGISVGVKLLAEAITKLGHESWEGIVKGIAGIAGSLTIIALAVNSMPPSMIAQAAGLVLVSLSLKRIAEAIKIFGGENANSLGKGLLGLAGALTILAVALAGMTEALPGAAALFVASAALATLTPALEILGHMHVDEIIKSFIALAGAMTILGIAGALLAPVSPALLALGLALLAIGGGLALAGAGVALIGVGLSAVATAAPIAIAVIIHTITEFILAIPKFISGIVSALVNIVGALAKAAPELVVGLGKILTALANTIVVAMPSIVRAFTALVHGGLKAIRDNLPELVKTGLDMIVALLKGIKQHVGAIITQAVGIVTSFINAIANHLPKILAAGTHLLVTFVDGIAKNIGKVVLAGGDIIVALIKGFGTVIGRIVAAGTNVLVQFLKGVANHGTKVISAAVDLIIHFGKAIENNAIKLASAAFSLLTTFLHELAKTIRHNTRAISDAAVDIGTAIIDGMLSGMGVAGKLLEHFFKKLLGFLPGWAKDILGISSPSKVFMEIGENVVLGLHMGIANNATKPVQAVKDMTNNLVNTMKRIPETLANILDFKSPVITPVLDLSKVKEDSKLIPGYINPKSLMTAPSLGMFGSFLPTALDTPPSDTSGDGTGNGGRTVNFTQINNSPTALSEVDIYRQTNNQLAQLTTPGAGP